MPSSVELSLTPKELESHARIVEHRTRDTNRCERRSGSAGNKARIFFYCRGQKVVNLRRNPTCTVSVNRNERFPELQGAMFQGRAKVLRKCCQEAAEPGGEKCTADGNQICSGSPWNHARTSRRLAGGTGDGWYSPLRRHNTGTTTRSNRAATTHFEAGLA